MLILSRHCYETLIIDEDIHITVLGIRHNQVRLGINAPKEITVYREELYRRLKKEYE